MQQSTACGIHCLSAGFGKAGRNTLAQQNTIATETENAENE